MKLYHATVVENKDDILKYGLQPHVTDKSSNEDERILDEGIFGFTNMQNAISFGWDNSFGGDIIVIEFEADADKIINDPEYDGEAKFIKTDECIFGKIVYNSEEE